MSQAFVSPVTFAVDVLLDHVQHRLADAGTILIEARAALTNGNTDGAVGTLVPLKSDLAEAKLLLDALFALYSGR